MDDLVPGIECSHFSAGEVRFVVRYDGVQEAKESAWFFPTREPV